MVGAVGRGEVRKLLYKAVKDWKLEHYAGLYGDGKMILARAARKAGVSLWEMIDYVRTKKIPAQYDLRDLRKDLKMVYAKARR